MPAILCPASAIPDPGSKSFSLQSNNDVVDIFVVHKDGEFHAFINRCPHTGVTLEWQEDQFLDRDQAYIQCASHDALFDIDTGLCIHGPCTGDSLAPVKIEIDGDILLAYL